MPSSVSFRRRSCTCTWREPLIQDRKSTRLNSSHLVISYAVFCLKKKKHHHAGQVKQVQAATSRVLCDSLHINEPPDHTPHTLDCVGADDHIRPATCGLVTTAAES